MPSVRIGGVSITSNTNPQNYRDLSGVAVKKEARHDLSNYDLGKLKNQVVEAEQLQDGQLLNLVAVTDQTSIDDVYDATQILDEVKKHFMNYDMLTPFEIVVPTETLGVQDGGIESETFDLFQDHALITYEQIEVSVKYLMKWIWSARTPATANAPAIEGREWVETDLTWSGDFLFNQMSKELQVAIKDDLKDKHIDERYINVGPIVLKALCDRMLSSNYNALQLLQGELKRENITLDHFDGDIEKFCKRMTVLIKRLSKCEARDVTGTLIGPQYVPSDLSESFLLVLMKTGHREFDLVFQLQYAQGKEKGTTGVAQPFEPPLEILTKARQLFVSYRKSGDWGVIPGDNQNPSGFTAGTKITGKCFGCGREGCRQDQRTCPRFGKTPLPEGDKAKEAFQAARKQKRDDKKNNGGQGKKKWPAKPGDSDPRRQKINGAWHYYHFKSKKWLRCDDQTDAGNQKAIADAKAKKAAKSGPPATRATLANAQGDPILPAALATLVQGKEENQEVRLQTDLFVRKQKALEEEFQRALGQL